MAGDARAQKQQGLHATSLDTATESSCEVPVTISEMRDFRTMVKVTVNGFGHIGRLATSSAFNSGRIESITRGESGAKQIVESARVLTALEKAGAHLKCGAKTAKVTHDDSGITEELMTTVCANPATQKTTEGPSGKLCTAKTVGKVTPELNAKLVHGRPSWVLDLTCRLKKAVQREDIQKVVESGPASPLRGILGYMEDQLVSCVFKRDTHSSTSAVGSGTC
ncbi:hypothetical protein GH733_017247 [Mirounga leonina]|nr:hypothetical protein GH733_017247 [Mirounga leonina]